MPTAALQSLLALAATRPEGAWPDQLDLDVFHRTLGTVSPAALRVDDVEVARRVRDTAGRVLLDADDDASIDALDEIASTHALVPTLRQGQGQVSFRTLRGSPDGAVWADVIGELMAGVAEGARAQVRRCSSAPCTTPFFDTTPAGTKAFCCDRCATRARVRKHRARTR